jgi:HK97 gp10 family phage protein
MGFTSFVDKFKDRIGLNVDAKMRRTGEAMKAEARRLCPVDTGFLQSTIGYLYRQPDKTIQLYVDASYGFFKEFGTRFQPATPFMRPAVKAASSVWGGGPAVEIQLGQFAAIKTLRSHVQSNAMIRRNTRINVAANHGVNATVRVGSKHAR